MAKRQMQELARKLRSRGLSYSEIGKSVPVSKGTISNWCKDIELSENQKKRLGGKYDTSLKGAKAVQARRKAEVDRIIESAKAEIAPLKRHDLKDIGLMLYWAEGNKTVFPGITNSDADVIRIMMRWFREVCNVPEKKFKAHLHIHSGQSEDDMKRYWSSVAGIPVERFGKSHIKREGTGHRKNRLYNGTIKINIFDKDLLYRVLGWIEGFKLQIHGGLAQWQSSRLKD